MHRHGLFWIYVGAFIFDHSPQHLVTENVILLLASLTIQMEHGPGRSPPPFFMRAVGTNLNDSRRVRSRVCVAMPVMAQPYPALVRNSSSRGPPDVDPYSPSSTKMATARSPCSATIHAWVCGGSSVPNSAVPVFGEYGFAGDIGEYGRTAVGHHRPHEAAERFGFFRSDGRRKRPHGPGQTVIRGPVPGQSSTRRVRCRLPRPERSRRTREAQLRRSRRRFPVRPRPRTAAAGTPCHVRR